MFTLEVELHHVFVNCIKTIYFVKVGVNILTVILIKNIPQFQRPVNKSFIDPLKQQFTLSAFNLTCKTSLVLCLVFSLNEATQSKLKLFLVQSLHIRPIFI